MWIAVVSAAVVGSFGGGLAALYSSAGSPATPPLAAPAIAEPAAPNVRPTAPAIAPDPNALLAMQMRAVLARFVAWSRDHAGAPCPDGAALGVVALDPWGHAIELTCTDQPADQRIGAISAGADGITGNGDDVVSWALGHGVTDPVRGPRWKPAPAETTAPPATQTSTIQHGKDRTGTHDRRSAAFPAAPRAPSKPGAPPSDGGTDDIPAHR